MQPARIRGVILDVDGTLLDSNDAHANAWMDALEEAGFEAAFEEVRGLIGMGGDKLSLILAGAAPGTERANSLSRRRVRLFMENYFPTVRALAGARELVLKLKEAGLRLAVASSSKGEELQEFLKRAKVDDLIEIVTSSDDARRSKADPDIVAAALSRMGLKAAEVVMIGDTPYDVESAARVGISTIAFRSGGWADQELKGAIAVYDGPADLVARFDSSSLGRVGAGASASRAWYLLLAVSVGCLAVASLAGLLRPALRVPRVLRKPRVPRLFGRDAA